MLVKYEENDVGWLWGRQMLVNCKEDDVGWLWEKWCWLVMRKTMLVN